MAMRTPPARRDAPKRSELPALDWPPSLVASLRHSTLPEPPDGEGLRGAATALGAIGRIGERDALSLIGQMAAWLAFARFAGVCVTAFVPSEWGVLRSRGRDVRLVRLAAPRPRPSDETPPIDVLESFATLLGAPLPDSLRQSWTKPESTYVEIHRRLRATPGDLSWLARSARGTLEAPGAECLEALASSPKVAVCDDPLAPGTLLRFAALGGA